MKRLRTLAASLVGMGHLSCAQAGDMQDRMKACAQLQGMEHMICIDDQIADAPGASQSPNWIMSETTSPVDYKPQMAAQTIARVGSKDAPTSLAIHCRAHRTELLLSGANSLTKAPATEIRVVLQINGQVSVDQPWRVADGGRSLAFPGDAVRLIRSMPDAGRLLVKVYAGTALAHESGFVLIGLDVVRRRLAEICGWPRS